MEKSLSEHRISEFLYFYYNKTIKDSIHYCPVHMIQWCGLKTTWNRHNKNNVYEKFKTGMQWYFENGYLIDFDIEKYKNETFQCSLLNMDKLIPEKEFGLLYDFEIDVIMEYKTDYRPLTKSVLLLLLSYIRAYTWKRVDSLSGHSEGSKKRKPEIFHAQIDSITSYTGLTRQIVTKAIIVLEKLGLVTLHKMPRYQDESGNWHTDETIFICPYKYKISNSKKILLCSDNEYDSKKELDYGIMFLREQKYYSKKFYQK